jgi:GTPase SAR1 family protein
MEALNNKRQDDLINPGEKFLIRVFMIGEVNAGKTTFINAAANGEF